MTDSPSKKKQKVLHTRVSEELEKDLKSKAAQLGISVSNLVRNVLLNTVDLVETVVVDSARIAGSAKDLAAPNPPSQPSARPAAATTDLKSPTSAHSYPIVGWQDLTLNLNAICVQCNAILRKGEKAAIAVPMQPEQPKVLCLNCLPALPEDEEGKQ